MANRRREGDSVEGGGLTGNDKQETRQWHTGIGAERGRESYIAES